jgi:putative ABC transport system permease protein
VINQAFAARYWPGEDPIGRRIAFGDPDAPGVEWVRIVGIVGDTRVDGLDRPPVPEAYLPYSQAALNFTTLVVRSDVGTAALAAAIRRVIAGIDPEQPLHGVASMEEVLAGSLDQRRFTMTLLALFAAMALVLAAVGLYGVLSSSVAQREREIGIRRALGAQTAAVVVLVTRQGARLLALGLGLGWLASLALSRFIASQIHGVSAADPTSYGLGALVLAAIALVSSLVPALRAARVDPATILRAE